MRRLSFVMFIVFALFGTTEASPASALTVKSSNVVRLESSAARLTTYTTGNGSLYVNLKGLAPGVWNEHLWTGTCANLGTRVGVLPGLVVPSSGALARTNTLTSAQAKGKTVRLVRGSQVLCGTFGAVAGPAAPTGPTETARVVRVVDGDTIVIDRGRGEESLRYIGVDTPETVHPSEPVEWMGKEASDANRALVEGRDVILERDVSEVDQYGRLLRYVWIYDGATWTFINFALVAAGFAQVDTYPPDVKYVDSYLAAQQSARDQGIGLWAAAPSPTPSPTPAPTPQPSNCHPSYAGVCLRMGAGDYDCAGGSGNGPNYVRGPVRVVGYDEFDLDRDNDGVGCES